MEDLSYFDEAESLLRCISFEKPWLPLADTRSQFTVNDLDNSGIPPESRFTELPMEIEDAIQPDQGGPPVDCTAVLNRVEQRPITTTIAKRFLPNSTKTNSDRNRHDKKPREKSPNLYGRKGVPRCLNCRKWRQKVRNSRDNVS